MKHEEFCDYVCENFKDVDDSFLLKEDVERMVQFEFNRLLGDTRRTTPITTKVERAVFSEALENCRTWLKEKRVGLTARSLVQRAVSYNFFKTIKPIER
jgi:hypothetical protein